MRQIKFVFATIVVSALTIGQALGEGMLTSEASNETKGVTILPPEVSKKIPKYRIPTRDPVPWTFGHSWQCYPRGSLGGEYCVPRLVACTDDGNCIEY